MNLTKEEGLIIYLIIILFIIASAFIFRLFYCAGELNTLWDDSYLEEDLDDGFDKESDK